MPERILWRDLIGLACFLIGFSAFAYDIWLLRQVMVKKSLDHPSGTPMFFVIFCSIGAFIWFGYPLDLWVIIPLVVLEVAHYAYIFLVMWPFVERQGIEKRSRP